MDIDPKRCNFIYSDIVSASEPYTTWHLYFKRYRRQLFNNIATASAQIPVVGALTKFIGEHMRNYPTVKADDRWPEALNLQPGDWVQVRTAEEIFSTLDDNGRYRGLYFMPEMVHHCGKKYKVFKKVERIMLESTGEMRKIISPTVFLEGSLCEGKFNEGCDRSCFFYWREIWLDRVIL